MFSFWFFAVFSLPVTPKAGDPTGPGQTLAIMLRKMLVRVRFLSFLGALAGYLLQAWRGRSVPVRGPRTDSKRERSERGPPDPAVRVPGPLSIGR